MVDRPVITAAQSGSAGAVTRRAGRLGAREILPSLTGLRFIGAFAVFWFHIHAHGLFADGDARGIADRIFAEGPAWLAYFFILSGFVLTWGANPADSARSVWGARFVRIFPNHVVVWLFVAAAVIYVGIKTVSAGALIPGLLLMQAWVPDQEVYFALNTPAWSLSCEVAFCAAFPLLLRLVRRIPGDRLWLFAGLAVVTMFVPSVLASAMPLDIGYWLTWIFPVTRSLEFIFGMVLARIVYEGRWIRVGLWAAVILVVLGFAATFYLTAPFSFVFGIVIPFGLLISASAVHDLQGRDSPLRSRPMIWLGKISFAFYLVHQVVIRSVDEVLGERVWPLPEGIGVAAGMLAVALLCSWLLYRTVERPMLRRFFARPSADRDAPEQNGDAARYEALGRPVVPERVGEG